MNTREQKQIFENMIQSENHQNFIFDLVKDMDSERSVNSTVRFLMSDEFIALQVRMAKKIRGKSPEDAARSLSLMIISFAVFLINDIDDEFDELGFQK